MDVAAEDRKTTALIRDLSVTGAYVLSTEPVEVGADLSLVIHLTTAPDGPVVETHGVAVRVDPVPLDRSVYWTHGIALRFAEPLDHLQAEIDALGQVLERAGLRG